MEPLLHEGQVVFVDRHAYRTADPTEGDIVVAHHPWRSELLIVKRVESVGPDRRYHLVSENRAAAEAQDSRTFGPVRTEQIVGRVTSVLDG